jgi:hypothetical protein
LNFGPEGGSPFFAFVVDDLIDPNDPDPADLRGGKRAPRRFVDWQTFFDFGDGNSRPNKKIDAKLSTGLFQLLGSRGPSPGMPADPAYNRSPPAILCAMSISDCPPDRRSLGSSEYKF